MSQVAVIIVNYGTPEFAIEAVESVLAKGQGGRSVEVHLVDNASPGGDADRFAAAHAERSWGAQVTLWAETENHGFGRGNNVVLKTLATRAAPPDYVFLLNPDAVLENDAVEHLAGYLDRHPEAGAAGASVRMPDDDGRAAAFRFPSPRAALAQAIDFGPARRLLGAQPVALDPGHPAGRVDWVTGAAVMFRFPAIRDVGFFDPAFFLYFEEVDLMRRLTEAGWEVHYQPDARVLHHEGVATNVQEKAADRRRRPAYVYRSWRRYHTKAHGRLTAGLTAFGVMIFAALGLVISAIRRRPTQLPLRFFRDHWRYVLGPLTGVIRDPVYDAETVRFGQNHDGALNV